MFDLLTQILLWVLIAVIARYLLSQFIKPDFYQTPGFLVLVGLIGASFITPDTRVVSEVWSIFALIFRPLGLALIFLAMVINWKDVKLDGKTLQNQQIWILLILYLSSMPATAYWVNQRVEAKVVDLISETAGDRAPVVVVMAQGTTLPAFPPRTQVEFTPKGDRLRYAAEVFLRNGASVMIVTGAERSGFSSSRREQLRETNEAVAVLQTFGVPGGSIIVNNDSGSIQASAQAVRQILTDQNQGLTGVRSLILVSSAMDIERATGTFTKTLEDIGDDGVTIIPRATNFYSVQEEGDPRHKYRFPQDLLPNEHALAETSDVIQEYFARIYYFLRGWISSTT